MVRIEDKHLSELEKKTKDEQIAAIRREYIDNTSWISKGTITGGADFIQGGFNSSHFPLELIQNADDEDASAIRIELSDDEIRIFDDGSGFDLNGVVAVCQQGRSPKRSDDQIGFMGIGFKSLFEVCNRVEVHSNGYHFAFGTNTAADVTDIPEQFVPESVRDLEHPLPYVPDDETDDTRYQTKIVGEISDPTGVKTALSTDQLAPSAFLFLRNLNEIRIHGSIGSKEFDRHLKGRTVPNPETVATAADRYDAKEIHESDRVVTKDTKRVETKIIESNGSIEKWALFRNIWEIPEGIPRPQFREQISEREMFVALPLDESNRLTTPSNKEGSVRVSPVHSYLPIKQLSEVELDFIIHADFDLDPTRTRIKSDSKWNEQMAKQVRELVLTPVLRTVANHPVWKENLHYLVPESVPASDEIIGELLAGLVESVKDTKIVSDRSGKIFEPNKATRASPAVHSLFTPDEVELITKSRPVKPTQESVLDRLGKSTEYSLVDLLKRSRCKDVLSDRLKDPEPSVWFSKLYRELAEEEPNQKDNQYKGAFANEIILTQNGTLCQGRRSRYDDSWTPYLPPKNGFDGIDETRAAELSSLQLVHTEVLRGSENDLTPVRELFKEYGAKEATALTVVSEEVQNRGEKKFSKSDCKAAIQTISTSSEIAVEVRDWMSAIEWENLPTSAVQTFIGNLQDEVNEASCTDWISSNWTRLDDDEKEASLRFLKDVRNDVEIPDGPITVRTEEGEWAEPKRLIPPEKYNPTYNFEQLREEYPDAFRSLQLRFVDPSFVDSGAQRAWKELFKNLRVGQKVSDLVGRVGETYVARQLGPEYHRIDHGADFESEDGSTLVEVKSTKEPHHDVITIGGGQITRLVECEDSETEYLVYPVVNVLDHPSVKPRKLSGTELLQSLDSADFDMDDFS
jgi:hypothetical protein